MSIILCCKIIFDDLSFINITNSTEDVLFLSEVYNFGIADSYNYQKELLLLNSDLYKNKVFNNNNILIYFFNHNDINNYIFYRKKIIDTDYHNIINLTIFVDDNIEIYNKLITNNILVKCRAKFCDNKCGLDIEKYTFQGKIVNVINKFSCFKIDKSYSNGVFNDGAIIFTSGNNKNCKLFIDHQIDDNIFLLNNADQPIEIDDEFNIIISCDKGISTCNNTFMNKVNFQGEPYII
ncbi:MAG: phage BR0599 family protein [Anaplasmataceae bacterium]|nr:phage BR0599 family protein [Anaplasmataceae bacterium]